MKLTKECFSKEACELASKHFGLARKIAWDVYKKYDCVRKWGCLEDVDAEALCALHAAAASKTFDPGKAKFTTYAGRIIANHILDAVAKSWMIPIYVGAMHVIMGRRKRAGLSISDRAFAKAERAMGCTQFKDEALLTPRSLRGEYDLDYEIDFEAIKKEIHKSLEWLSNDEREVILKTFGINGETESQAVQAKKAGVHYGEMQYRLIRAKNKLRRMLQRIA